MPSNSAFNLVTAVVSLVALVLKVVYHVKPDPVVPAEQETAVPATNSCAHAE